MTDADDDFGRAFAELLHQQRPGLEPADLAGPILSRARVVRRRRRTVATVGLVAALATVAAAVIGGAGADRLDTGPVAPISASPVQPDRSAGPGPTASGAPTPGPTTTPGTGTTRSAPKTVDLDVDGLAVAASSPADWVGRGVWHKTDGTSVRIGVPTGPDQVARFLTLGNGLVAEQTDLTGAGRSDAVWLVAADGAKTRSDVGTGAVRGPEGSVLWLDSDSVRRINPDGSRSAYPLPPAARAADSVLAATRAAVFLAVDGTVTRYALNGDVLFDPVEVPGATEVVLGHPSSDQVVVRNDDLCTAVLSAAAAPVSPRWDCRYRTTALSPNGQWSLADDADQDRAVLVGPDGNPQLSFKRAQADNAAVTDQGEVVLLATKPGQESSRSALVACSSDGRCRRVSTIEKIAVNSGDQPLSTVGP